MIFPILFSLGLAVGSFLNVLIDRLPKSESIVYGRSHCDRCKKKLAWYDLIPVFSFIILKRKCRYCKNLISWQYPLIEILTGLMFIATYSLIVQTIKPIIFFPTLIYLLIVFSGLIVIFFADLKYMIIPDQIIILLIIASLSFTILFDTKNLTLYIVCAFIFSLVFLLLVLITRGKGMGMGDAKFAFFMGLFLGFPKIVISFYLAFLTGALISLILVIGRVKKLKSTVPFGPFLVLAAAVTYIWGETLWIGVLKWLGI